MIQAILVAPNAFKESLTAFEAARAMVRGVHRAAPRLKIFSVPIADGGDGTLETLLRGRRGKKFHAVVHNPLEKKIRAAAGLIENGRTAVIEMAAASGLKLLSARERNPMRATSLGTGELIRAALDHGCREIILGVGGSATVDGGLGAMHALGVRFFDHHGQEVWCGGAALEKVARIDLAQLDPRLNTTKMFIACDVQNVLLGSRGAAAVYGPQKGATPAMVTALDRGLRNFARIIQREFKRDVTRLKFGGAAGGIAAGFQGILDAALVQGAPFILDRLNVKKILPHVDVVLTGEGKIDSQTFDGKAPAVLAELAMQFGKPTFALGGTIDLPPRVLHHSLFKSVISIVPRPMGLGEAMRNAASLLEASTARLIQTLV